MKKLLFTNILFLSKLLSFGLTFNVDMSNEVISPEGIHIAGNFQDNNYDGIYENPSEINWDPAAYTLSDPDGDQIYSITLNLVPGVYEYKFINGNSWYGVELVPQACQESINNDNRQIIAINNPSSTSVLVCFSSCAACGESVVRFSVDMSTVDADQDGSPGEYGDDINPIGVYVAGSFQDWNPSTHPLQDIDGDNIYEGYYSVGNNINEIEYKFINGNEWVDPNEFITGFCGDGSSTGNRFSTINELNTVLPTVCWNGCGPCLAPTPILFQVDMSLQTISPNGVHIAGSFQNWNPSDNSYQMTDPDGNMIYEITLMLPQSDYEYKFVNGNDWSGGEYSLPIDCSIGGNRFISVGANSLVESYCFNQCYFPCGEYTDVGITPSLCSASPLSPKVLATNYGETEINSIDFIINTTPVTIITWNGLLYPGSSTLIDLFPLNGSLNIPVQVSCNVAGDFTEANNILEYDPNNLPEAIEIETNLLTLNIQTDGWPSELFWQIKSSEGTVVANGGNYANGQNNDLPPMYIFEEIELSEIGCYTFHLYDTWGDGMTWLEQYGAMQLKGVECSGQETIIAAYDGDSDGDFSELVFFFEVNSLSSENEVLGCTDETACNFNPLASCNNGSCSYIGSSCNDGNQFTINDVYSSDCICSGTINNGCDPSTIDWSNETSILLPNVTIGDNLAEGFISNYYSDNIYINTPTNLDLFLAGTGLSGLPLQEAVLTGIQILINDEILPIETLGLSYTTNNGMQLGSSTFMPGIPGCIEIFGTPNQVGVFPLSLTFYVTTTFFGNQQSYSFEIVDYQIIINNNPFGCTNIQSCNFNPLATIDDSSCIFIGSTCDDGNPDTFNDVIDSNCQCSGFSLSYGYLNSTSYFTCADNTSGINLSFDQNPIGISEYNLQWYYRNGIQPAPSGTSTLGWTLIPGATSPYYTTNSLSGNRTFACYVTPFSDTGLPSQWANNAIHIEVSNFSAQAIIGNPNITPFTSYVYVVNPIQGNTYNWSSTNGGIISGQGTNTVTVMWGQNGPYQISLTESNGSCSDESTLFVVNNNCSISVAAISTDGNEFCAGTSTYIQAVTTANGITYQWYLNGVELSGETNIDLEITTGGNYQVMITQGACTAISQTLVIVEFPAIVVPDLILNQTSLGCAGGSATITIETGSFTSYLWSNGETASFIEINASGDYTVLLSDANGCEAIVGPMSVNFALIEPNPICLVTVDPTTGNNTIVWEPVTSEFITDYLIYKETNVANEYALIGSVDYGSDGIFTDENSNSAVQASRYKIGVMDICNVESTLSSLHKTIHLTSNLGVGNTVNLIWSHYEGAEFGSYNIYRGTAADNMTLLTTIASNLNSYTDLLPITDGYYMIEVEGISCDPSREVLTSTSNIITITEVGINEGVAASIRAYPNPASTFITLEIPQELIGETIVIYDVTGREIYRSKTVNTINNINVAPFSSGSYVLRVGNQNVRFER